MIATAQKEEIKNAQIELNKNKKFDLALKILNDIEYRITNAKIEDKSEYYFTKAKVHTELANKNIDGPKNMSLAVSCYNELILQEVDAGKLKYAALSQQGIFDLKNSLESMAIKNNNSLKYSEAGNEFLNLYEMDSKDTIHLYNAAANFLEGKEFEKAIRSFEQLKKLKYTGKGINYYATNKTTQKQEIFYSIKHRDLVVAQGDYINPKNEVGLSKKGKIYKYLGYMYAEKGDFANAESNYKAYIDDDPKNIEAYLDIISVKMDMRKEIAKNMSLLGTTDREIKEYDKLNNQKNDIIKSTIPYLEKALLLDPNNKDAAKLLLSLYRSQEMMDKYEALKLKV